MNNLVSLVSFVRALIESRRDDEKGAVATEYALLLFLVALAIVLTVTALGGQLNAVFQAAVDALGVAAP